jgi:hypothetical protein
MSEPTQAGAVVRANSESVLEVEGYVSIKQIPDGPNRGKWEWRVHAPVVRGSQNRPHLRNGIAKTEGQALQVAGKALSIYRRTVLEPVA